MNWTAHRLRGIGVVPALGAAIAVLVAAPVQAKGEHAVRDAGSCTPKIVYAYAPGTLDATGTGAGEVAVLSYTDGGGIPQPDTTASVEWEARAIVSDPKHSGGPPRIGGNVELDITTVEGDHITYDAKCVVGAGSFGDGFIVYANGKAKGWPGDRGSRRSLVHFEAWSDGVHEYAYVALIDGADCALNFDVKLVTQEPWIVGSGALTGIPPGFALSETDCSQA